MTQDTQIRRNANGSIDLNHYVKIGRTLHGQAVRTSVIRLISAPDKLAVRLTRQFSRWRRRFTMWSGLSPAE